MKKPKTIKQLTPDAVPSRAKGHAHRVLRVAKRKAHYAAQPMKTIANKQRTLARHIRKYPEDQLALKMCIDRYRQPFADKQIAAMTGKARARVGLKAKRAIAHIEKRRAQLAPALATLAPAMLEPPAFYPTFTGAD